MDHRVPVSRTDGHIKEVESKVVHSARRESDTRKRRASEQWCGVRVGNYLRSNYVCLLVEPADAVLKIEFDSHLPHEVTHGFHLSEKSLMDRCYHEGHHPTP